MEMTLKEALEKYPEYRLTAEVSSIRFRIDRNDFDWEMIANERRRERALSCIVEVDRGCNEIVIAENNTK